MNKLLTLSINGMPATPLGIGAFRTFLEPRRVCFQAVLGGVLCCIEARTGVTVTVCNRTTSNKIICELLMKAAALDESVEATMPQCHIYIYINGPCKQHYKHTLPWSRGKNYPAFND